MKNKTIYSLDFIGEKIKTVKVDDVAVNSSVTFKYKGGEFGLSSYHSQDCCESVYADFSIFNHFVKEIKGNVIEKMEIKAVNGMGFLVCMRVNYSYLKIFVPCYNYQNGYYSSNLSLVILKDGVETKIDISDLVEDHID